MPKQLKVFGGGGYRPACPAAANGTRQTREIVAAFSTNSALKIFAANGQRMRRGYISQTGNELELAVALAEPGKVFWRPLNDYKAPFVASDSSP